MVATGVLELIGRGSCLPITPVMVRRPPLSSVDHAAVAGAALIGKPVLVDPEFTARHATTSARRRETQLHFGGRRSADDLAGIKRRATAQARAVHR